MTQPGTEVALFEPDVELTVTLPWPTLCALACQARCERRSLAALVAQALEERVRHA